VTVGSLFSGIGGFDLGFERAGFEIKWQVEIDDYASAVLAQHWPNVRRYRDVREIHGPLAHTAHDGYGARACARCAGQSHEQGGHDDLWRESSGRGDVHAAGPACLESVDVVCGGFPCQPHSLAGKRAGADDERDLWPHFARLVRELRPRWVVAENVPGLLSSDAGRFFGTVLGDLAACGYDAEWDCLPAAAFGAPHRRDRVWIVAYPHSNFTEWAGLCAAGSGGEWRRRFGDGDWWAVEPNVGRVAHGVPARVDRLRGLGNSIVPQIAEWIARRIAQADA
jgi:DNA (cytosine-5)-methyltransferase 1